MADEKRQDPGVTGSGDRRQADRRKQDRRAPLPLWRRPWALVLYGVLGTLVVLLFLNRSRPPQVPAAAPEVVTATPPAAPAERVGPTAVDFVAPEDARRMADYERLMAEGTAALGRTVRVELYCSSITQVALRSIDQIEASVAELADAARRVPAAECKWGERRNDDARADVMLLVPPELAEAFAQAPVVDDAFVSRRRVIGVAEWVGRSEALALRPALVLREYPERAAA
jgi:hypothetical protein